MYILLYIFKYDPIANIQAMWSKYVHSIIENYVHKHISKQYRGWNDTVRSMSEKVLCYSFNWLILVARTRAWCMWENVRTKCWYTIMISKSIKNQPAKMWGKTESEWNGMSYLRFISENVAYNISIDISCYHVLSYTRCIYIYTWHYRWRILEVINWNIS